MAVDKFIVTPEMHEYLAERINNRANNGENMWDIFVDLANEYDTSPFILRNHWYSTRNKSNIENTTKQEEMKPTIEKPVEAKSIKQEVRDFISVLDRLLLENDQLREENEKLKSSGVDVEALKAENENLKYELECSKMEVEELETLIRGLINVRERIQVKVDGKGFVQEVQHNEAV